MNATSSTDVLATLAADRVLTVVRAPRIDDPVGLCNALATGGIRVVELTYTTPDLPRLLERAAASADRTGALVGAGTVLTAAQARTAVDAGARFLVTPGLGDDAGDIVEAGRAGGAAVILGALTPSEVMRAVTLGADAVKIFPARLAGPTYHSDLRGPFPDVSLIPSGGVNEDNAASYLAAGALAVTAGTSVVAPADVTEGRWADVTDRAARFCASLR